MVKAADRTLNKVVKGTLIFFVGTFIYQLLEFACRIIIARGTTQTEYGIFSLGYVLLNLFVLIAMLGLDSGTPRYIAYFREKEGSRVKSIVSSSLKIALTMGLLVSLFAYFSADIISQKIFHSSELGAVLKIFAIAVPFVVLTNILVSIFRGFNSVKEKIYFQDILMSILRVSFIIAVLFLGYKFIGIIYAYLLSIVTATAAFIIYSIKRIPEGTKTDLKAGLPLQKELLFFSLPLLATSTFGIIMNRTDTLMLGYFKTADIVGLYNAAYPISHLISVALLSMRFIYMPIVSHLYSKNLIPEIRRNYVILTKWVSSATLPLFLIFFIFPESVISILFGADYVQASTALQVLSLGYFINNLLGPNGSILIVLGETRFLMWASFSSATFNVILNALLIIPYGIVGASIATVISLTLINLIRCWKIYSLHGIYSLDKNLLKPLTVSIGLIVPVCFFVKYFINVQFWVLPPLFVLFSGVYLMAMFLTKSFESEDLTMILAIEKRFGIDAAPVKNILRRFL